MQRVYITAALVLWITSGVAGQSAQDEQQLGHLLDQWVAARNANNLEQMRAVFDSQMDHVNVGTGEVIATDADGSVNWFDRGFKGSRAGSTGNSTFRVLNQKIRVLSPAAALIDFRYTLHAADGQQTTSGSVVYFCVKRGSEWKVGALRYASQPTASAK